MSFWKKLIGWLDGTLARAAEPDDEPQPESPPPSKATLLKQDVAKLVSELGPHLTALEQTRYPPYYRRTHHVTDLNYFDHISLTVVQQPEGYYACELKLAVRQEKTHQGYVDSVTYDGVRNWVSYDQVWFHDDQRQVMRDFLADCPVDVATARKVTTPLFGDFTNHHRIGNIPVEWFFIGDLPLPESIEGNYTPENHETLMSKQTALRDRYRDFAKGAMRMSAKLDAEAVMAALTGYLSSANALHLSPGSTLHGSLEFSSLLLDYALDGGGYFVVSTIPDYGRNTAITAIAEAVWLAHEYHAVYQELFAAAMREQLTHHRSADQHWEFTADGLLSGHGDRRGQMRFWLQVEG